MISFFRQLSFQTKLLLSFAVVIVLTTVIGYIVVNRSIDRAFTSFSQRSFRAQDRISLQLLADYYERMGSWEGIDRRLARQPVPFVLSDPRGVVLAAPEARSVGERLPESVFRLGLPIFVGAQIVGILVPLDVTPWKSPLEERFLSSVTRALVLGACAVGVVGIVISVLLLRQVTDPLRRLGEAAGRIARGQFSGKVEVASRDELGALARSFNDMAASLARAEESKRQMTADVAHELRTPLSVLRAGLEGLRDGVFEATPEHVAALYDKVLLTSRLVADLQELALADAGGLSIRRGLCDPRTLVEGIAQAIGPQLEDAGVTLAVEVPADLPQVEGDAQRLEQVLLNLLSNAVRHTPSGGTIRIAACEDESSVRMSVCDTGPGLSEEDLTHVFDRFYHEDKAGVRSGVGLGLAIAKALVEAHGGRIWAENAAGGGACFRFALPSK